MMKSFLLIFILFPFTIESIAQDLIAGEITYQWISGNNYEIKFILLTRTSANINRDTIFLNYGDGSAPDTLIGSKQNFGNDVSKYSYFKNHIFPGPGTYIIFYSDSFRIPDIYNIYFSSNTSLSVEAQLKISPFGGQNNSSITSYPLIDTAFSGIPYQYNLGFTDSDGDSLVFSLTPISQAFIPDSININPTTGQITWNIPDTLGNYILAIRTDEYRNGNNIGSTIREILIVIMLPNDIEESATKNMISIYPNPVIETLTISFSPETMNSFYEIYDLTSHKLDGNRIISPNQIINTRNYTNGIYLLSISDGEKKFFKEFIKE